MKKLILAAALLTLSSCVDLTGQLKVFKGFQVKSNEKQVTVSEGQYKANLDIKKNRIKVTLENASGKVRFEVKNTSSNSIPQNGAFELKAAQINQPFNIIGQVQTKVSKSGTKFSYETCTVRDTQTVCTPQGCYLHQIDRIGQKHTEYYDETKDQKVDFNIVNEISVDDVLGEFTSASRTARRVIVRQSQCW